MLVDEISLVNTAAILKELDKNSIPQSINCALANIFLFNPNYECEDFRNKLSSFFNSLVDVKAYMQESV